MQHVQNGTLGPTAPCSIAQHVQASINSSCLYHKTTHVKAGGGQQQMQQITSSTFSQLPSPLPHLYKLCPLQSPPFHCHPTHSIRPPINHQPFQPQSFFHQILTSHHKMVNVFSLAISTILARPIVSSHSMPLSHLKPQYIT